jgi:hypothetical protein
VRKIANDAFISDAYQSGLSIREVAAKHKPPVCYATVRESLMRSGVTRREVGDVEGKAWAKRKRADWVRRHGK